MPPRKPSRKKRRDPPRQESQDRQRPVVGHSPAKASVPPSRPRGVPNGRHRRKDEETYHGQRACEAIFNRRPDAIRRVYLDEPRSRQFGKLLAWCPANKRGFQVVDSESLRRLTGSFHHEGIAILAQEIQRWMLDDLLRAIDERRIEGPLVFLDRVSNPHNLGSILRTAAHFGVGCVMGRAGDLPPISAATARVAEGAAEIVPVCALGDPAGDMARLEQSGYRLVATASGRGESLFAGVIPDRTIIALGSEGKGVSKAILERASRTLRVPGTDSVESLNVSVACGVVLAEVWRRSHGGGRRS